MSASSRSTHNPAKEHAPVAQAALQPRPLPTGLLDAMFWTWLETSTGAEQWDAVVHWGLNWVVEPDADRDTVAYERLFRAALLARYDPTLVQATKEELRTALGTILRQQSQPAVEIVNECKRVGVRADDVDTLVQLWIDVVPPSKRHERRIQLFRGRCVEELFGPEPISVEEELYDLTERGKLAQLCQTHGWSDTIPLREVRDRALDTVWHMQCARLVRDHMEQLKIEDCLANAKRTADLLMLAQDMVGTLDAAAPDTEATHAEVRAVVNGWCISLRDKLATYNGEEGERLGTGPLRSVLQRIREELKAFVAVHYSPQRLLHVLHCRFRQHATAGVTAELDCSLPDNRACVVMRRIPIRSTERSRAELLEVGLRTDVRYVTVEHRSGGGAAYGLRALPEGAQTHGDTLDNILLDPVRTHGKHAPVVSLTLSNIHRREERDEGRAANAGLVVDFANCASGVQGLWHYRTVPCTLAHSTSVDGRPYVRIALAVVGAEDLGDAVVRVVTGALGEDPHYVQEDSLVVAEVLARLVALIESTSVPVAADQVPHADHAALFQHAADRRFLFAVGPVLQQRIRALLAHPGLGHAPEDRESMWRRQLHADQRVLDDADGVTPLSVLHRALTGTRNVFVLPPDLAGRVFDDAARLAMVACERRTLEPGNVHAVTDVVRQLQEGVGTSFLLLAVSGAVQPMDLARLVEAVKGTPVRLLLVRSDYVVESLRQVGLQGVLDSEGTDTGARCWELQRPSSNPRHEPDLLPHWKSAAVAEKMALELSSASQQPQLRSGLNELLDRLREVRGCEVATQHGAAGARGLLIILPDDMGACEAACRQHADVVDMAQTGDALERQLRQIELGVPAKRRGDGTAEAVLVLANSHLMSAKLKQATLLRAANMRLPVAFLTCRLDPADFSINLGSAYGQLEAHAMRHYASAAELAHFMASAASLSGVASRLQVLRLANAARMLKMLFGAAFEAGSLASAAHASGSNGAGTIEAVSATLCSAVNGMVDVVVVRAVVAEVCRVTQLATVAKASNVVQGLVHAVRCVVEADPTGSSDVSFQHFVEAHPLCHDAPQSMRAYLWLQLLSCAATATEPCVHGVAPRASASHASSASEESVFVGEFDGEEIVPQLYDALLKPDGVPCVRLVSWNVQTPQVCSLLSEGLATAHQSAAPPTRLDHLSFLVAKQPHGQPLVQHALAQLQGGLEAPWLDLTRTQALASSFELLMTMVLVCSFPLKVVRTVRPERLFELLRCMATYETASGIVPDALAKLAGAMADPLNRRVLQQAMPNHWSVLKWHFAGTRWEASTGAEFPFSREDLERLIDLRVPISFTSDSSTSVSGRGGANRELAAALGRPVSGVAGQDFVRACDNPADGIVDAPQAAAAAGPDSSQAPGGEEEPTAEERRRAWLQRMLHILRRLDGLSRDFLHALFELRNSLLQAPASYVAHLLCHPTSQSDSCLPWAAGPRAAIDDAPEEAQQLGVGPVSVSASASVEVSAPAAPAGSSGALLGVYGPSTVAPCIGSAIVDFLLNESVIRAAVEAEGRSRALLIHTPFVRWLHAWLLPAAQKESLLGGHLEGCTAEDIVAMPDAELWPLLLSHNAAREVWACMHALSAHAFALMISVAPSESHAAIAYRVSRAVLAARAGREGVDAEALKELLAGLAMHAGSRTRLAALDWMLWRSGPQGDVLQRVVHDEAQLAGIPGVSAAKDPYFYFVLIALRDQHTAPLACAPDFPLFDVPCCAKLWLSSLSDERLYFGDELEWPQQYQAYTEYVQGVCEQSCPPEAHERRRLLQHLLRHNGRFRSSRDEEFSCRALMLVLWAGFPQESVQLESGAHEIRFLLALCQQDGQGGATFGRRVYESLSTMSALALFIAAPHQLSLTVYNAFAGAFGRFVDREPIAPMLVLVGQRGDADAPYPAYFMQLYRRPLPDWRVLQLRQELRALLQRVNDESGKFPLLAAIRERGADMHGVERVAPVDFKKTPVLFLKSCFLLDVSSGVSAEVLLNNLAMLYVVIRCCNSLDALPNFAELPPTLFYAHNVLWAWFFALGWSKEQVLEWMQDVFPELADGFTQEIWKSAVQMAWREANRVDHAGSTLLPFPAVLDLRDAAASGDRTFMGAMQDDALYTLQLCTALLPPTSDPVRDVVLDGKPLSARVPHLTVADLLTSTRPVARTEQYLSLPAQFGWLFGQIMAVRLAQPGMLQSAERGTVAVHRRFDNLASPESAGSVAHGAAEPPPDVLPCVRVTVQLRELQTQLTPLAALLHRLNAEHDRSGASAVDIDCLRHPGMPADSPHRPLAMLGSLVMALVGAVHATLQELVPDDELRGYLQAAFFRALFATVGVSPLQNTQRIHGAVVYHFDRLHMKLCGRTVRELNVWPVLMNTHVLPLLEVGQTLVRGSLQPVLVQDAVPETELTAERAQDILSGAQSSALPLVHVEPGWLLARDASVSSVAAASAAETGSQPPAQQTPQPHCVARSVLSLGATPEDCPAMDGSEGSAEEERDVQFAPAAVQDVALVAVFDDALQLGAVSGGQLSLASSAVSMVPSKQVAMVEVKPVDDDPNSARDRLVLFVPAFASPTTIADRPADDAQWAGSGLLTRLGVPREGVVVTVRTTFNSTHEAWQHLCAANTRSVTVLSLRQGFALRRKKQHGAWTPAFVASDGYTKGSERVQFWDRALAAVMLGLSLPVAVGPAVQELALAVLATSGLWQGEQLHGSAASAVASYLFNSAGALIPGGALRYLSALGSPALTAKWQRAHGAARTLLDSISGSGKDQVSLAARLSSVGELSHSRYKVDGTYLHDRLAAALFGAWSNDNARLLLSTIVGIDVPAPGAAASRPVVEAAASQPVQPAVAHPALLALKAVTSSEFADASWSTLQALTVWTRQYCGKPSASKPLESLVAEESEAPTPSFSREAAAAEGLARHAAAPVAVARTRSLQEWSAISSLASGELHVQWNGPSEMPGEGRPGANPAGQLSAAERKRLEEERRPPAVSSLWGVPCDRLLFLRDIPDEEYTEERGQRVMFVVTAQLFDACDAASMQNMRKWVVDVLRAPIHPSVAEMMLQHAAFPGLADLPLPSSVLQLPAAGSTGTDAEEPVAGTRELSGMALYYGLARRCPLGVTRRKCERAAKAQLCSLLVLGEIQDLLSRVGGETRDQYAMHVVWSVDEMHRRLWRAGLTCCVLDVGAGVQAGTVTEAHIYHRVRRLALDRGSPFVLIRGLPALSDRLFKLLSEFTQRTPWVAVLLEDTETRWLLPENQDRLVKSKRTELAVAHSEAAALRRHMVRFDQQLAAELVVQEAQFWAGTALQEGWEGIVRKAFKDDSWIMLSGSPGIGKTYFIRDELLPEVEGTLFARRVEKDASNDEFLRKSVAEVMAEELAGDPQLPKRLLLLLDETHMSPNEFLRRFLDFVARRQLRRRDIKLVMLSNRLDKDAATELSRKGPGRPAVTIIRARGSVEKLLTVRVFEEAARSDIPGSESDLGAPYRPGCMSEERCKLVLFAYVFTRIINALFGDLAMSLRHVPAVLAELRTLQAMSPFLRDYGPLARLLQNKFVMLPTSFCVALVRATSQLLDDMCKGEGSVWRTSFQAAARFMDAFAGSQPAHGHGEAESYFCLGGSYNRDVAQAIASNVLAGDLPGAFHFAEGNGAQARRGLCLVVLAEMLRANSALHCSEKLVEALASPDRLDQAAQALVLAGPADMEGDCMPYPEFVASGALAQCFHHHPLMRISCWLVYVRLRSRLRFGGERLGLAELHEQLRRVAPRVAARFASECTVSDLPMQFPQLHMGRPSMLSVCEVVSADVDPRNVEELVRALERGFSFDEEAAKEAWAQSLVLTADQLDRLLAARPDLLRVLAAPGRFQRQLLNHVRTLVSSGPPSLASRCLSLDLPDGRTVLDMAEDPSWPTLIAMWRQYRHADVRKLAVSEWLSGSSLYEQACMFLWAARFGFSLCTVPDRTETREELLRQHLLLVSAYILRERRDSVATEAEKALRRRGEVLVAELWSSQFAALLPEPGKEVRAFPAGELGAAVDVGIVEQPDDVRLPAQVLVAIAAAQHPPKSEWPSLVQQISSLLRGMLSATEASAIVTQHTPLVARMLQHSAELSRRLLECELSIGAQRALLSSQCCFPKQTSMLQYAQAFVDALQDAPTFDDAVGLPGSDMRTSLSQLWETLHRRHRPPEERSGTPLLLPADKLLHQITHADPKKRKKRVQSSHH